MSDCDYPERFKKFQDEGKFWCEFFQKSDEYYDIKYPNNIFYFSGLFIDEYDIELVFCNTLNNENEGRQTPKDAEIEKFSETYWEEKIEEAKKEKQKEEEIRMEQMKERERKTRDLEIEKLKELYRKYFSEELLI